MYDVTSEDEFVMICECAPEWNIYAGVNERVPGHYGASGVGRISNVLVDVDSIEPGSAGTQAALQAAFHVGQCCINEGIHNYPVVACSGNGAYVWLCVPPRAVANPDDRSDMRIALRRLATRFVKMAEGMAVKIDTQVTTDIARIIRVIGTPNLKDLHGESQDPVRRAGKMSYWASSCDRVESPLFWPYVDALHEVAKRRGETTPAAWVLPAPAPEVLEWLYSRCQRMAGLAGRPGLGSPSELEDYALWLYFGANLVKAAGSIGAQEWHRVSESAPGYNPLDWDCGNPRNKIQEVAGFNGPPHCEMMGCPRAGQCGVKSPAGVIAKHPKRQKVAAVDTAPYLEYSLSVLEQNERYARESYLHAQGDADMLYYRDFMAAVLAETYSFSYSAFS